MSPYMTLDSDMHVICTYGSIYLCTDPCANGISARCYNTMPITVMPMKPFISHHEEVAILLERVSLGYTSRGGQAGVAVGPHGAGA